MNVYERLQGTNLSFPLVSSMHLLLVFNIPVISEADVFIWVGQALVTFKQLRVLQFPVACAVA